MNKATDVLTAGIHAVAATELANSAELSVQVVTVVVSCKAFSRKSTFGKAQALPFFLKCGKMIGIMAKKNNTKRKLVGLVSEESGVRAYYTKKNTMNTPDKLSLRKYDPVLRKHVLFVETKKNLGRNEVKEKKR